MILWLLALALAQEPVQVMLNTKAYVGATLKVSGQQLVLPGVVVLPEGTHEGRLVTRSGQVVVKRLTVPAPKEGQALVVVSLDDAPAAGVPGVRFLLQGVEGHLVYVDGVLAGPSPVEVLLAPGSHLVEQVAPDGARTSKTLELKPTGDLTPIKL